MTGREFRHRRWRLGRKAGQDKLTQARVGKAFGLCRQTIMTWENSTRPVPKWVDLAFEAMETRTEKKLPPDRAELTVKGFDTEISITRLKGKLLFRQRPGPGTTTHYWTLVEGIPKDAQGDQRRLYQAVISNERLREALFVADDLSIITIK